MGLSLVSAAVPAAVARASCPRRGRDARGTAGKLPALLRQLVSREEKAQLKPCRVFRVGPVNGVVLDVGCPLLADGAFLGLRRIGGAHELAQVGDGVFL